MMECSQRLIKKSAKVVRESADYRYIVGAEFPPISPLISGRNLSVDLGS
jgi:hypothetical protein